MLKFLPYTRILLVRTDNIGDVLLTTPALSSLRRRYPDAYIGFLCRSYTAPILQGHPAINQILAMDDGLPFSTVKKIKDCKFDVSIHFYVESKSAWACSSAKILRRIGPFSKFWSYFLTDKIVQNRSKVEKHEAEYNLDLVRECGADGLTFPPALFLSAIEKREGVQILRMTCGGTEAKPIIIHPGSRGSAETWPLESFLELAVKVASRGDHVVFAAGNEERKIADAVEKLKHKNVHAIPAGTLTLRQLAAVIAGSKMFIGNSSGPLHIATALNLPTISFFPRTPFVTSAKRWGPFGNYKQNRIISPLRDGVPLSSITTDSALEWVINVLQSKATHGESDEGQMIG